MRQLFFVAVALAVISFAPATTRANIFALFGFDCSGGHNSGCARGGCSSGCGCSCEQSCCCDQSCGCEVSCGCEPACGCGTGCFANGCQFAGQKFQCGCNSYVPICPCTGPCGECCQSGCGACCEPACGCECGGCCEPSCGTGCGACCEPCRPRKCCLKNCGFFSGLGHIVGVVGACSPCAGCNGETYWSEWHNDPPRCQDPCNCQGQWIGPGAGSGGSSSCPCDGGFVGAQSGPYRTNNYAAAPVRGKTASQSMVAQTKRPPQSQSTRTATRPVNRGSVQSSGQPTRPIQW